MKYPIFQNGSRFQNDGLDFASKIGIWHKNFSKFDKSLKSDHYSLQSSSWNREESVFLIMAEFFLKMAQISKMAFVILT